MSTYAVFGMTRHRAIEMARKSVNTKTDKAGRFIPQLKWYELVKEEADAVMKSNRCVMLSEKFDAPQFALDFINLARRSESRDLHYKAYCKSDETNPKTGKPKMHWVVA